MNALDLNSGNRAELVYGDCEFNIRKPGDFVVCAVSGARIPLAALRYWNVDLQEAYAGPKEALARWQAIEAAK